MTIPQEALDRAIARRDAMVAAVKRGNLAEMQRLSFDGDVQEFEPGGRYRVAVYAAPGDDFAAVTAAAAAGDIDGIVRGYVAWLGKCAVMEFEGRYHGRVRFGVGLAQAFHRDDGQIGIVHAGDLLAFERLDADA